MYAFENVNISVKDNNTNNVKSKFSSREYKSIVEIMNNEDYRRQIIQRALSEVKFWKERHKELSELTKIFILVDEEYEKWQNKKQ